MASNVRYAMAPRWPVAACTSAHNSGDLVVENGKFGIAVETNAVGQQNTLIQHGQAYLPVPAALAAGQKLYTGGTTLTAGATLQAIGTLAIPAPTLWPGATQAPSNFRSAATASTLTTTATNVLVGTLVTPSAADGASTMGWVELAPQ